MVGAECLVRNSETPDQISGNGSFPRCPRTSNEQGTICPRQSHVLDIDLVGERTSGQTFRPV